MKIHFNFLILFGLLLCFISLYNCHDSIDPELLKKIGSLTYESLKKQAMEQDDIATREPETSTPITPAIVGRFFCDNDIKLNSIRQDVMTNNNYNK